MIKIFKVCFGIKFLEEHTVIQFSRWGYDKRAIERREEDKLNEEKATAEVNKQLEKFGVKKPVPTVFIDALHDTDDEGEKTIYYQEMAKLKNLILKMDDCSCEGVDGVKTLLDYTTEQLAMVKTKLDDTQ